MKKISYLLLAMLMISLIIIGCSKSSAPVQSSSINADSTEETSVGETPRFTTLKQVMGLGTSYECNFNQEGVTVNAKIKGENFATTASSSQGIIHSIVKEKMMWNWIEGQSKGYKMNLEELEKMSQGAPQGGVQKPDYDEEMPDLDCKVTSISDSTFNPPSSIEFQDMSKLLAGLGAMSG